MSVDSVFRWLHGSIGDGIMISECTILSKSVDAYHLAVRWLDSQGRESVYNLFLITTNKNDILHMAYDKIKALRLEESELRAAQDNIDRQLPYKPLGES